MFRKIGLHVQNLLIIPGSMVNMILKREGGGYNHFIPWTIAKVIVVNKVFFFNTFKGTTIVN